MLISVSGSQGSGKSTVLADLQERFGYKTVERKTSRSILSDWGVTLDQVNSDHELTVKFQSEIIKRKYEDEQAALDQYPNEIILTERTYADLFTYALVSLGKHNQYSLWLNVYYDQCKKLQDTYEAIFYLKSGLFDVVHDGVRGSNLHYSRMVDLTMWDLTENMSCNVWPIDIADRNERIEEIHEQIVDIAKIKASL